MSEDPRADYLSLLRRLATAESPSYPLALELWKLSMKRVPEFADDWIYHPSWLLWGALTDWVEVKPQERTEAEAAMVEAAKEFLAASGDPAAEQEYFDRWLYDRCGYPRP